MDNSEIIPRPNAELVKASEAPALLNEVRPAWQAKNLIVRVHRLLEVDPSSACQRLFNAAMHDLREKVVIAGIDIAADAAKQHGLPTLTKAEDIENYSTSKLIDLAYRIGLLSRPEWRRISRCYEIRKDLEHEDNEYEAGVEDCVYIFKTCVEVVLAVDPIRLLKVADVKDLIEQSTPVAPAESLVEDFGSAPQSRQEDICKFLVSIALDREQPDIVQQNAYIFLFNLGPLVQNSVKLKVANWFQERIGRDKLDRRHAKVAVAAGAFPYLRQAQIADVYEDVYAQMEKVGAHWSGYQEHGELLRSFDEIGGLQFCPSKQKRKILKWLVLAYIGELGGRTRYGNIRNVFYSNTAAPLIEDFIGESAQLIRDDLRALEFDKDVIDKCANQHVARRFQYLLDLVETSEYDTVQPAP